MFSLLKLIVYATNVEKAPEIRIKNKIKSNGEQ